MEDKKVFIAGGSGFVGSALIERLLRFHWHVVALVRNPEVFPTPPGENLELVKGDALEPDSFRGRMDGCSAVINSIGIIREKRFRGITFERLHVDATCNLLAEAQKLEIEHFLQISALGARADGVSRYQTTKHEAEVLVRNSGLHWTIFRPSFIIGPGAGFVSTIRPIVRLPITPVFGDGGYRFEPVDKRILAEGVARSIVNPAVFNAVLEFRGERSYSYIEILDHIGKAIGKKNVRIWRLPLWLARPMVRAFGWLPFSPISIDQLNMLVEGSTGSGRNAVKELNLDWIELPEAIEYALGRNK